MRKIIFIAVLFVSYFGFSQGGPKMNVAKFVGELTTTERNSLDVPTGERWLIWNATTEQFEHAGSDDVWSVLTGVSSADEVSISDAGGYYTATDVEAALQEIASDVAAISDTDDQTASEVNITDSGGYYTGTNVETALQEVGADLATQSDDQTASEVTFSPYSTITSTDVQSAIEELKDETDNIVPFQDSSHFLYNNPDNTKTFRIQLQYVPTSTDVEWFVSGDNFFEFYVGAPYMTFGYDLGENEQRYTWNVDGSDNAILTRQSSASTSIGGAQSTLYSFNKSGTPSSSTDVATKAYVDSEISGSGAVPSDTGASNGDVLTTDGAGTYTWETPSGGGSSLPVDDTTALVQDPSDNTKQVRIDAENVGTGNTAVLEIYRDNGIYKNLWIDSGDGASANIFLTESGNGRTHIGYDSGFNFFKIINQVTNDQLRLYDAGGAEFTTDLTSDSFIKDGATSDDILLGDGTTASLSDYVQGTISGRTGTDVTSVMLQTQAQFDSDGATSTGEVVFISDASPAEVVTSATIAMEGWKMYNDSSTDAATITLSDCDPGETLTVYINRASAPTLAGTGLTFNQLPNTTAFAAATDMMIIFEVSYDSTTIDYYYVER